MAVGYTNAYQGSPEEVNARLYGQGYWEGGDPRGNNELGAMYNRYAAGLYPSVGRRLDFQASLDPLYENAILGFANDMGPQGVQADIAQQQAGIMENAAGAARQTGLLTRAAGLGDGFQAGQTAGIVGQGAQQANAYAAQQNSPQMRLQRAQALLRVLQQGQSDNWALDTQQGLFGPIEQRHQQNQKEVGSGSVAGQLGGLLGGFDFGGLAKPAAAAATGGAMLPFGF